MNASLVVAFLWVLASAVTAMLPMRRQFVPGVSLLIAAPVILVWLGRDTSVWIALAGLVGFLSMFRNPLRYLLRRALGRPAPLPPELRKQDR